jgi:hypothetical protein
MIAALVTGWKSEGNWPPPSSTGTAAFNGTTTQPLRSDVRRARKSSAFAKWRKDRVKGDDGVGDGVGDVRAVESRDANVNGVNDGDGREGRVRRSIGMMKKALGGGGGGGGGHDHGNGNGDDGALEELGIEFDERNPLEEEENKALNQALLEAKAQAEVGVR